MKVTNEYTGPDYCHVKALDESLWEVRTYRGVLIGAYPHIALAQRVARLEDKRLLREYLRTTRRCA